MTYDFSKLRVLVVDDNPPMRMLVRGILETFGVKSVDDAENGEEAFKLFNNISHDLVIADWMMEPMDGIELTRNIRNSQGSSDPYVPIILITGYAQKKRVFQARDNGVTEFLVKPFTANDLYKRMVQVIERPRRFIKSNSYIGPDRRRASKEKYNGPLKRKEDHDKLRSRVSDKIDMVTSPQKGDQ